MARFLERLGAGVFDCDAFVHELYRPGGAGALDVAFLFGETMLDTAGGVDRDALAARVLDDAEARARLEGAIHPLVRAGVSEWLAKLESREVAVIEAALLVETGSWRDYDLLAVVWCEVDQQLERAVARGVPADRARRLLDAQAALDDKREVADIVIDNSGDRQALGAEVERAWHDILDRCRRR